MFVISPALRVRAAAFVLGAMILLRLRGMVVALRLLARRRRGPRDLDPVAALGAVRSAGSRLGARCLAQSVALAALLARDGNDPVIVLGCRRYGAQEWGSHAWVECAGDILEPVVADAHAELARCAAAEGWVPVQAPERPR